MDFRDISKALSEVASQYHFHKAPPFLITLREYVFKFLRWLNELWHELFSHGGASLDSKSISLAIQVLIVVVSVVAVAAFAYHLFKRMSLLSVERLQTIRGATSVDALQDAAGWKAHSEKLATAGDYRGACRALYLSLLQTLDENKIAQFAPTKTNYEYSYALSAYPQLQQAFKNMAGLVEVIWFGNKEADADDYARSAANLDKLSPEIRSAAAAHQGPEKSP